MNINRELSKQFRLGNFFKPTDHNRGYIKVSVADLEAWRLGAIYGKFIYLDNELLNKLGILTDEKRLEKNFIFQDDLGCFYYVLDTYFDENSNILDISSRVEYLHQVQNLYFLLNGEELDLSKISSEP
ncbi:hypothetical protein [Altibacter sp. HG106]|uniref:hypothetical protein n=1 Tax=Altibacter sp. HG106 TaxID=3023937 RepID=UPI0023505401|nr:hypothetical protein [Altibacter sp. HG106]MDC7994463.1 hypothetical protein [Altibacter sp. HG106]